MFTAVSDYKTLFDNDKEGICNEKDRDSNGNSSNSACNDLVVENTMNSEGHCTRSNDKTSAKQHAKRKKVQPSKILLKADTGNGKTTFSNKVFLDWARGFLAVFSIVFFVSMKLVNPGDVVENVIISQSPTLRRLKISKPKLQAILEKFGASVLIILDGMDQHDLQNSPHFLDLIEGAKYSCSILLTSRPHTVAEIEPHCETIVQLSGFSQSNAERYISKILENKQKAETVIRFVSGPTFSRTYPVHSPMMLLFLCVLVNNDENIDIDNLSDNVGEIYTKLIRSVYRAYCQETNITFKKKRFERLLLSIGKVKTEMKGFVDYYEKKALIHEVGQEAFDCGFLIGHEDDYRLLTHDAEIAVTSPHELIGSFFNVFFYTRVLGGRKTISGFKFSAIWKHIDKMSLNFNGLTDHVFIRFCLWFFSDRCSAKYLKFPRRVKAFGQFAIKISQFYDLVQLNFVQISSFVPALDVMQPDFTRDSPLLNLFMKALSKCRNIRELYMSHLCPVYWILGSIGCLSSLLSIINTDAVNVSKYEEFISTRILNDDDLVIIESAVSPLNLITHLRRLAKRYIVLSVTGNGNEKPIDVTGYFSKYVSVLQLTGFRCALFGLCEMQRCPFLSEIIFTNSGVDRSVLDALGTAMKSNNLSVISVLNFNDCGSSLKGKLKLLFKSSWPTLTYLDLEGCELDQSDVNYFAVENGFLPNLKKLCFGFSSKSSEMVNRRPCCTKEHIIDDDVFSIFRQHWPILTTISLHDVCKQQYKRIASVLNPVFLPSLSDLSIYILWEQLDSIEKLPQINHYRLSHLTLQRFVCAATHLQGVARSAFSCRLEKLNISHSSHMAGFLFVLVDHSLPSVHILILSDC